ncbi:hypothetical protein [Umezawaea beigongshangensis]|uniref:hypothetical protein n=1 Tax=Umezawaea beigongshangensis TaxID=2780383 RepID=UPI0018F213FF|nr:hypothetical protein [Umezawaea beigongshangensis]
MDEHKRALDEVERQRVAMAARIHLPLWFRCAFCVVWTGLLLAPVLTSHHDRFGLPAFPYVPAFALLLVVVLMSYRRRSGLNVAVRSRAYPALRRHAVGTAAVMGGGALVTWGLTVLDLPLQALPVGLVAGGLATAQVWRVNTGIRDDVLAGR